MTYTAYTTQNVFNDNAINVAINQLITFIALQKDYNVDSLVLSGNAASIIQDRADLVPLRVVPFVVDDALYALLTQEIRNIWQQAKVITFKDRIQITLHSMYIEIWLVNYEIEKVVVDDIVVQKHSQIPNHLI